MLPTGRTIGARARGWRARGWAVLAACILASGGSAEAAKLDEAACDGLKAERARIETEALKSDMSKGPQWAKENLPAERLKEIEQLIGLQESIDFRCQLPKPAGLPANIAKTTEPDGKTKSATAPEATDAGSPFTLSPGLGTPAAPKPAKSATTTKKPSTPAVKQGIPADKAERPPAAKSTSKSQKSKPKASDHYVPPPTKQQAGQGFGFADAPPASGKTSAATSVEPLSP